ncbi:MAG: glucoamylase family protein [Anaerolineales bacterium]
MPLERETKETKSAGAEANRKERSASVQNFAENHSVSSRVVRIYDLLAQVEKQADFLHQTHHAFNLQAQEETLRSSHAAEWVLDNYFIIQQTLRQISEDLPKRYYRELPKLDSGNWVGFPRIYVIARAFIVQEAARLSIISLKDFISSYQGVHPLTMGELWALPIMLRIGILEALSQALAAILEVKPPVDDQQPVFKFETPPDALVGHCIVSLRTIANQDWKDFFESVSLVEQTLKQDPADVYRIMDFDTRDRYRKLIENLARATSKDERDVAFMAIQLAGQEFPNEAKKGEIVRQKHVGYYLIDDGLSELEAALGYHPSSIVRLRRWFLGRHATLTYLGGIGLLTLALLLALLGYATSVGATLGQMTIVAVLLLIPAVTTATSLVNWIVPVLVPPRRLPKLDYKNGIPKSARTMVVIPGMITRDADIVTLLEQLELHYIRNADPYITFALLTDFSDADEKHRPEDEHLLERARAGLEALNRRYPKEPFYLFHRERLWNPSEDAWMGWERKRGKLEEFNHLLRGENRTSFIVKMGDLSILSDIKYVITLDADTLLARGTAHRLIGTLDHVLNRPRFDPDTGHISAGYTLLQPRTEIKPVERNRTRFTRIFAGPSGLDLYNHAVSDVYQDLFGEGIFVGKGIYDVDAFLHSLENRIPENALLSHDLFEGIHGRVGLVTDIILYEDFPPNYTTFIHRKHRWIRGDWQLLPWIWPRVPHRTERSVSNPLSPINIWKIVDNMRRSLVTPALMAFLIMAWFYLPGSPLLWTLIAIFVPAMTVLNVIISYLTRPMMRSDSLLPTLKEQVLRWLLFLVLLPYESLIVLAAVITVFVRLFITHKKLLQWTTTAHSVLLFDEERKSGVIWYEMYGASVLVLMVGGFVIWRDIAILPIALPFLVAWFFSPQVAVWLNRPVRLQSLSPQPEQLQELRDLARSTWLYFEQFVGPVDHWLPPDHFQEHPRGLVAHRTSPTNIGLGLLSTLAAYDLGYLGMLELSLRLQNGFQTLQSMEKYRGHFLNWYDTRTKNPLSPRYVSTVDSGNLAACLLVLSQACQSMKDVILPRWQRWQGLLDTLHILNQMLGESASQTPGVFSSVRDQIEEIEQHISEERDDPERWPPGLVSLADEIWPKLEEEMAALIDTSKLPSSSLHRIRIWMGRAQHNIFDMHRRLDGLMPWLKMLSKPPGLFVDREANSVLGQSWDTLLSVLPQQARVGEIEAICDRGQTKLAGLRRQLDGEGLPPAEVEAARQWCDELDRKLNQAARGVFDLLKLFRNVGEQCERMVQEMAFDFLYDTRRHIFRIGYNVDAEEHDANYYDLLASEARTASLIAIAKGDVPQEHWLFLDRPITRVDGRYSLVSWSGTMFEFLMPNLWTQQYENTLLFESAHAAAQAQISYARQKGVPWGISESGYYRFDAAMNYQYRAFGLPGLAFKRGLEDDLVISPYASILALDLDPHAVVENLHTFRSMDMWGDYGLYDAVDYTPERLALGQDYARIRTYMAHHQAMILLSLLNYLKKDLMVQRFHAHPWVRSVELLLQEKVPNQVTIQKDTDAEREVYRIAKPEASIRPWAVPLRPPLPQVHYLSNGNYGLLITNAGGGFSRWRETDLTRWRADKTCDDWGTWIYLQDKDWGELWSLGAQPASGENVTRAVIFSPHKADFKCQHRDLSVSVEITVPPGDDLEVRRVRLTNHGDDARHLCLASYGEIVLAQQEADRRHPAFNKLFIESQYLAQYHTLLFTRRSRSSEEHPPVMAHAIVVKSGLDWTETIETDRERFLGRGGRISAPAALKPGGRGLSGTTGAVLDPIMSISAEIELPPHATVQLAFLTLAGDERSVVLNLVRKYQDWASIAQSFSLARSQSEEAMRHLELKIDELQRFLQLLSLLLYPYDAFRAKPEILAANEKGQSGLWAYAISGDYPIFLARIYDQDDLKLAHELLRAFIYWRNRGLKIDLVFINEQAGGYSQDLQSQLQRLLQRLEADHWLQQRGGIFLLQRDAMSTADQNLLLTAARVVLDPKRGSLIAHLNDVLQSPTRLPAFIATPDHQSRPEVPPISRPDDLRFDNTWGGFDPHGREYVIYLSPDDPTPAPWINVIANPDFGCMVSERGAGYTWALNSGENRLTPWSNDPVQDRSGEVLYLRDEETAQIWTPTPAPVGADTPHLIRHGAGYSVFESQSHGLYQRLQLFVAPDAPVKIIRLRLKNLWDHRRRITTTYYAEWVLGVNRDTMQQYIVTEYDQANRALLARNPYNAEFGERIAFLTACQEPHGLTTDRTEFLGRLGNEQLPAGLRRVGLSGTLLPGLDPCAALQLHIELEPGESQDIYFVLGQGADRAETVELIKRFQNPQQLQASWEEVRRHWDDLLEAVQVDTPDEALNILLNRWLPYQNLSCRIWGRSAFYQSGGAYGFRDQLQDVAAALHQTPELAREHILRAARHQFEAGDVLHWWHPPSGRGIRTRISDDLLWLPYVTAHYVRVTGDETVLREKIPFRKGEPLQDEELERYDHFEITEENATLYEHCCRALEKGATSGSHGLPLIGTGDWNDGLNRVGIGGQGESVWLGWFVYGTLRDFVPMCERMGDEARATKYREMMASIKEALAAKAWDGDWYLRAFYDDGSPLGSAANKECQIDSIAQSWAVLSGAGDSERTRQAMESMAKNLIKDEEQLMLLFTPPFDKTSRDPGYIRGYPPGIRENGGQYTHAAIWAAWAFAEMGDGDRAGALFRLLNPILHSDSREKAIRYRSEPYVTAADVYSVEPYIGRGGWTWYTGSSGWLYRLGLEAILGLNRQGDSLSVRPCVPKEWNSFSITYRFGEASYRIRVENPEGVNRGVQEVTLDGETLPDGVIPLKSEKANHEVSIRLGRKADD